METACTAVQHGVAADKAEHGALPEAADESPHEGRTSTVGAIANDLVNASSSSAPIGRGGEEALESKPGGSAHQAWTYTSLVKEVESLFPPALPNLPPRPSVGLADAAAAPLSFLPPARDVPAVSTFVP